jgi:dGTPase
MQWPQLLSTTRYGQELRKQGSEASFRSEFQRDYDRLIFSSAFRRMQNKTQVFPLPGSVFVHNRLTHSLEVASVGRSLGNMVADRISEQYPKEHIDALSEIGTIVSTACLAHDMGNPPFGHSGEKALSAHFTEDKQLKKRYSLNDQQWNDLERFEGNANALRLLTHRFAGWRSGGFSLTYATLATLIKYPFHSADFTDTSKYGFFASETETFHKIVHHLEIPQHQDGTRARHPLVYLVEAADDISYLIMDLEDAHKLGIIPAAEAMDLLKDFHPRKGQNRAEEVFKEVTDPNECISYLRAITVNMLAEACAGIFMEHYEAIMAGTFSGSLVSYLPNPLKEPLNMLRQTGYSRIYNHRKVVEIELAGFNILGTLMDEFISALDSDTKYHKNIRSLIPGQYQINAKTRYEQLRAVIDYLSGMTDVYALEIYRTIKGIEMPSLR